MNKLMVVSVVTLALSGCFNEHQDELDGKWVAVDSGCEIKPDSEIVGFYHFEEGEMRNAGVRAKLAIEVVNDTHKPEVPKCVTAPIKETLKLTTASLELMVSTYPKEQQLLVVNQALLFGEPIMEQAQLVYHPLSVYQAKKEGTQ